MKKLNRLIIFSTVLFFGLNNYAKAQVYCTIGFSSVAPITKVKFGQMTNTSPTVSNLSYENFTSIVDTVQNQFSLAMVVQGNTGGNYTDSVVAYFDWNQNGIFTDVGEKINIGTITNSAGIDMAEAAIHEIAIPNSILGTVRMRITKMRAVAATPCNNTGTGQAEDYTLYVKQNYPCAGVGVTGAVIGSTQICINTPFVLSVDSFTYGIGTTYQWEKLQSNTNNWNTIVGATSNVLLQQGISAPTVYRLSFVCANNGLGWNTPADTVNTAGFFSVSHSDSVCAGNTIFANFSPCNGCGLSINGPNGFTAASSYTIPNATTLNSGWYNATITLGTCVQIDSYYVSVSLCQDSVWPGDVNKDFITNNIDALYLAQNIGQTGAARLNPSIAYIAQACPPWASNMINGVNRKHADCNGDAIVTLADTLAININYGLSHLKQTNTPKPKTAGLPDLYFDTNGVPLIAGDTVFAQLKFGSASIPVSNILGLAGTVTLTNVNLAQQMTFGAYNNSWLGNSDILSFSKNTSAEQLQFAYAKTNQQPVSGHGEIAYVKFIVPQVSSGVVVLKLDDIVVIDTAGNVRTNYNVLDDTIHITTNINVVSSFQNATILPNPSMNNADLLLNLSKQDDIRISILNIVGKQTWVKEFENISGKIQIPLPNNETDSGIYIVQVFSKKTGNHISLKWLKN